MLARFGNCRKGDPMAINILASAVVGTVIMMRGKAKVGDRDNRKRRRVRPWTAPKSGEGGVASE